MLMGKVDGTTGGDHMIAAKANDTDRRAERAALVEDLSGQRIVAGDKELAAALAEQVKIVSFLPGEDLLTQGDESDHMIFVLRGCVDVVIGTHVVASVPGSCLMGEMALFQPKPIRSATVRATELTVCAELSAEAFKDLSKTYPLALRRMTDIIMERDPTANLKNFTF